MADHELDTSGQSCPLPLLNTKKKLRLLESGETLKVITTDPGAEKDFEYFCKQSNNLLEHVEQLQNSYHLILKKG